MEELSGQMMQRVCNIMEQALNSIRVAGISPKQNTSDMHILWLCLIELKIYKSFILNTARDLSGLIGYAICNNLLRND